MIDLFGIVRPGQFAGKWMGMLGLVNAAKATGSASSINLPSLLLDRPVQMPDSNSRNPVQEKLLIVVAL
jgi:hypothetical protein